MIKKLFVEVAFFCLTALLVISCAELYQTKPNTPNSEPLPIECNDLASSNILLARELAKLPEVCDGISDKDATALSKICNFYNQNQKAFNLTFDKMYDEGHPNVRKFCTPLQALYWMALEDKLGKIDISNYSLVALLNAAWYKSGFEYDGSGRWDHFVDVTARLNSPKLLDYYESRNFSYRKVRLRSLEEYKNPYHIFRMKQGECWLYTAFTVHCLRKAGYQANAITVYHGNAGYPNHVTCEFMDKDGKEYILDNSLPAYIHPTGIYDKKVYMKARPYYGKGYLTH